MLLMIAALASAPVALRCDLQTVDKDPPMFVTLNDDARTVQVTMDGRSYMEDTVADGPLTFWQVRGTDGVTIRSRLNRADGTLTIASGGQLVKGTCQRAPRRF